MKGALTGKGLIVAETEKANPPPEPKKFPEDQSLLDEVVKSDTLDVDWDTVTKAGETEGL